MNAHCGLIVNSSRGIIFADRTENFAVRAREEAFKLQKDIELLLVEGKVLYDGFFCHSRVNLEFGLAKKTPDSRQRS